jgi:ceroid-lipofuscinosis neuronal protein 5
MIKLFIFSAENKMLFKLLAFVFLSLVVVSYGGQWPVPYERVTSRPTNVPYCQASLVPFCPTGKTEDAMIYADDDNDTIEIFAMKKPVWSFKYGDLMAQFVRLLSK